MDLFRNLLWSEKSMIFEQIYETKEETYLGKVGDELSSKICQKERFKRPNEVSKEVQC
jgi:hypothetical protein